MKDYLHPLVFSSSILFMWSHISDDSRPIRMGHAVNCGVLRRIHWFFLSHSGWRRLTDQPCPDESLEYDTLVMMHSGPWMGTKLRCLVIMKTYRSSSALDSPPLLQPEARVSRHLHWLRFITAHFHRPPVLHAQSSVPVCLFGSSSTPFEP